MKNMKKILLLALCTIITGITNITYSADEFTFDLDNALNEVDNATGTTGEGDGISTGSSAKAIYPTVDAQSYLNSTNKYYDPALIEGVIAKYKEKNYVGCIQEAQSKLQSENPNPIAMYYMALSYTQIGDVKAALDIYDRILKLNPGDTLTECAIRGRDCLIGGPACPNLGIDGADIDLQVQQYKESSTLLNDSTTDLKELPSMLVKENSKTYIEKKNVSDETVITKTTIPNNDEIANALKTLQNAGIALNIQPQVMGIGNYNSDMAQMSMLLGNNSNQNHSFDMLPYMLSQSQNNPNQYNPQMMQAMMMNYMMPSMDFNSDNKN